MSPDSRWAKASRPHYRSRRGDGGARGSKRALLVTYLALGALLARSQERVLLKAYFLMTAVLLTVLVGLSRVYLGVHRPSDVAAG